MGSAALQQAQLNGPDLDAAQGSLHHIRQTGSQAAQLGMAEAVGAAGLRLGNEGAVGIVDALGNGNQAVLLLAVDPLHIGNKRIHIEVHLGQVDQIRAVALDARQSGSGGQPAGVTAHALHDGDHAGVVHLAVTADLHEGGGDILGCGSKAGAVIGAGQVVVDGLGHAHDPALIAHLGHVLGDLVAGVHGVVAAVIEEVAHIVLLENLQDPLVVGVVHIGIGNLVAAGAQGGGGSVEHVLQLLGIFLVHNHELIIQHALDAVERAVDLGDAGIFQTGLDHAVGRAVDNRGRTAGLTDDQRADKILFGHIGYLQ